MRLYSTLARGEVELPAAPAPVGMYVCGPTVYARAHFGNARPYVVASWVARWLRQRGYEVTLVHNITDVNDKIYAAAKGNPQGAEGLANIPDNLLDAVIESAEECPGECIFIEVE